MPVVIKRRASVTSPLPPCPMLESEITESGAQPSAQEEPESGAQSSAQVKDDAFVETDWSKKKRQRRRQHFDRAVERLAPYLAAARQAGQNSEAAMINYLNERNVPPPTGKVFTAGAMHRVLVRESQLSLGPGSRSASDAAKARPSRIGLNESSFCGSLHITHANGSPSGYDPSPAVESLAQLAESSSCVDALVSEEVDVADEEGNVIETPPSESPARGAHTANVIVGNKIAVKRPKNFRG